MRAVRTLGLALAVGLALAACGDEEDSSKLRTPGGGGKTPDGVDEATAVPPLGEESNLPLPRLSRDEYVATLGDLLHETIPTAANEILQLVKPLAESLPADQLVSPPAEKHGGFARLDQSQQQMYADVPFQVANQIGREVTKTPARITSLVGDCAATSIDQACFSAFVKRFGELALRRPLEPEDVTFYLGDAPATNVPAANVASTVTRLLSAPRFLYHVESGTAAAGAADIFALDAWELASRLSYHFWGTMPDATLREAARTGAILEPARYDAEIARLFENVRTSATLSSFFTQWFWPLLELPALDSRLGDATFRAFAGANTPSPELRGRMVQEVVDTAMFIAKGGGSIRDLLTNRQSFARDAELAAIYGVPAWNGTGAPPELPPVRAGLLTRAAFLTTGTANTRPIMKGTFIRTTLLCDEIPPPPQEGMAVAINLSPTLSTRQVIEEITEKDARCSGCHKSAINPLGFASENFDSLGRARTTQTLFDGSGNVVGQAPIDTRGVPRIGLGADPREASGIAQVSEWLAESGRVEACFAERYFRFSFRRIEATTGDRALIDVLAESAKKGTSLKDVLTATARRPEFKRRRVIR